MLSVLKVRGYVSIFGTSHSIKAKGGNRIGNYVHNIDLVDAHFFGLSYLLGHEKLNIFNFSNGNDFLVRENINISEKVSGIAISVVKPTCRSGDLETLVGSSREAEKILKWKLEYTDLERAISHSWQRHVKQNYIQKEVA